MRAGKIIFISFIAGLILSAGLSAGGGTGLIDVTGIFGRIEGIIVDSRAGQPVIGASVSVIGTRHGAVSDRDGRFEISYLPPGSYSLRVMHLNYWRATVEGIEVVRDSTSQIQKAVAENLMSVDGPLCPNPALHGHPPWYTVVGKPDILDKFGGHWGRNDITWEAVRVRPVYSFGDLLARVAGVRPKTIDVERTRRR